VLKFLNNPWLIGYLFIPILIINLTNTSEQQFVFLADSFLKGSFSFVTLPHRIADLSLFEGFYYWPEGLFPAILLMPFVFLSKTGFLQGYLQFPLTCLNFYLVYKICKTRSLSPSKSLFVALFYILGSIYTPIATIPWSWFFAQVVTTTLLLSAIYIFLTKKTKYLLIISILLALAILTRLNLLTTAIFFIYFFYKKPNLLRNLIIFSIPIMIAISALGFYNFQRFGSIFESGYNYQIIPDQTSIRRAQGLISIKHIPANLYYMLFKLPETSQNFPYLRYNSWGMSIFILSPILFLLIRTNLKEKYAKISLITSLVTIFPIIVYYGIGYVQIGYRYALDIFPFLLLALIPAVKKISDTNLKLLVISGILITWFFTSQRLIGI